MNFINHCLYTIIYMMLRYYCFSSFTIMSLKREEKLLEIPIEKMKEIIQ